MTVITTPNKIPTVTLELAQGADFSMTLFFLDDSGAPLPLTGWTFKSDIRRTANSAVVKSLTTGSGITVDAPNGQVSIFIAASDTTGFPSPKLVSDIFGNGPSSAVAKLFDIIYTVKPRVTR